MIQFCGRAALRSDCTTQHIPAKALQFFVSALEVDRRDGKLKIAKSIRDNPCKSKESMADFEYEEASRLSTIIYDSN